MYANLLTALWCMNEYGTAYGSGPWGTSPGLARVAVGKKYVNRSHRDSFVDMLRRQVAYPPS